jgi:endonuclease-3 related protein
MSNLSAQLQRSYQLLMQRFGPQHWWPAESPLEVMVGAILTQNTNWQNVERALNQMREHNLLQWPHLHTVAIEELAELIRPAGYYRVKAQRLRNLTRLIAELYDGDLDRFLSLDRDTLRELLLSVRGIGPETADSIILYAARQPIFVVDTYTARVMKRHAWIEPEADYAALQDGFHSVLPEDTEMFNEFHALIVRVGKEYCRPQPRCEGCPLESLLPATGPELTS